MNLTQILTFWQMIAYISDFDRTQPIYDTSQPKSREKQQRFPGSYDRQSIEYLLPTFSRFEAPLSNT